MLLLTEILEIILRAAAVGCMVWGCISLIEADPALHNGDAYYFRNGVRWTAIGMALGMILILVKSVAG